MKTSVYSVTFSTFDASTDTLHQRTDLYKTEEGCKYYYDELCKDLRKEADTDEPEKHLVAESHDRRTHMIVRDCGKPTEFQAKVSYDWLTIDVQAPQIFLFDLTVFTRQEADKMTWEKARELAQVEKGMRHVWQYDTACGTFAGDFNRGCITPDKYYIRIYTAEE